MLSANTTPPKIFLVPAGNFSGHYPFRFGQPVVPAERLCLSETAEATIRVARHKPYEVVRDWHWLFDLKKSEQQYGQDSTDVLGKIKEHIEWSAKMEISGIPTFYVNGKQLPDMCGWVDYLAVLEYELKNMGDSKGLKINKFSVFNVTECNEVLPGHGKANRVPLW